MDIDDASLLSRRRVSDDDEKRDGLLPPSSDGYSVSFLMMDRRGSLEVCPLIFKK